MSDEKQTESSPVSDPAVGCSALLDRLSAEVAKAIGEIQFPDQYAPNSQVGDAATATAAQIIKPLVDDFWAAKSAYESEYKKCWDLCESAKKYLANDGSEGRYDAVALEAARRELWSAIAGGLRSNRY